MEKHQNEKENFFVEDEEFSDFSEVRLGSETFFLFSNIIQFSYQRYLVAWSKTAGIVIPVRFIRC